MPRGDGPFKVLAKINDNAYKIDTPDKYVVNVSFNVADLIPFYGFDETESRTTPFQEGEDDVPQPPSHEHSRQSSDLAADKSQSVTPFQGPITRSRAKKLQTRGELAPS